MRIERRATRPVRTTNRRLGIYEYRASVESVHDGDTFTILLDLGLLTFRRLNVRMYGINAPELATPEGPPARDHLIALLGNPLPGDKFPPVVVRTHKDAADKYGGRWLATVWLETDGAWSPDNAFVVSTASINGRMITDGFAKPYFGHGPKQ